MSNETEDEMTPEQYEAEANETHKTESEFF